MLLEALLALASQSFQPPVIAKPPLPPPERHIGERIYRPPLLPPCKPLPVPGGRLVLLSFYEGAGMSRVAAAGEMVETTTGELRIASGRSRFVLAITSYDSMIFRITGATRRIRQLVLINRYGSGVTGVPRAKVRFVTAPECLVAWNAGGGRGSPLPRKPDLSAHQYELDVASFDGRRLTKIDQHRAPWRRRRSAIEEEMYRFYPAGVVRIDPRAVVSAQPARPYRLLPSTAGVWQLERAGAISHLDESRETALREAARRRNPNGGHALGSEFYEVRRPIRVPIDLCGAHLITFVVRSRDEISGDPCHSNILGWDGTIIYEAGMRRPAN